MPERSKVSCRLFLPEDLPALYAIEEVCFEAPVRFSRSLMRSLAYSGDTRTWLGLVDGIRAGFAIVGLYGENDPNAAYIWTIEVLPGFRRLGIARSLLSHLEGSARSAGATSIELHVDERNRDAQSLYLGSGFFQVGVDPGFYGLDQDALCFRKPLT